jgi:hypothetical protein
VTAGDSIASPAATSLIAWMISVGGVSFSRKPLAPARSAPNHPAHAITRQYRERVQQLLEDELRKLGHPHPARAASQLLLVIDGTLAAGATRPEAEPAARARELAEQIIGI